MLTSGGGGGSSSLSSPPAPLGVSSTGVSAGGEGGSSSESSCSMGPPPPPPPSSSVNTNDSRVNVSSGEVMDLRRTFEGQLNKFTNVVKGWQYRWFLLEPENGVLSYYLVEEMHSSKPARGQQYVAGCVVIPSDEDSQTFSVNFASAENYKLRASNVKERQQWVDRIRGVAQMHDKAIAQNVQSHAIRDYLPPTPPGSKSHISQNGEPSDALQHLSLSVLDAFGSVHDILHQSDIRFRDLSEAIERCESHALDDDMLILKATSQSALLCMENALTIIQNIRQQQPTISGLTTTSHISKSKFNIHSPLNASPKKSNPIINNEMSSSPTKSMTSSTGSLKRISADSTSQTPSITTTSVGSNSTSSSSGGIGGSSLGDSSTEKT